MMVCPKENPPITPSLALIAPCAFTWNPLDDITKFVLSKFVPVALPLKKKVGVGCVPLNIEVGSILNPPIFPASAVIVPCITTSPSGVK